MSPRTLEQLEIIKQNRKKEILDVALKLFASKSHQNTRIEDITKAAGISKGLFYNYFASKDKLLEELVQLVFSEMAESVQLILSYDTEKDDAVEVITKTLYLMRDSLKEKTNFWALYTRFIIQLNEDPNFENAFQEEENQYITAVSQILEDIGFTNTKIEARKLNNLLDGVSINYILRPNAYPLDEVIESIIQQYQKP
ncbi:MAG: TetR/AcrR family transcriptional regulator [Bacteroidota bacterium]